MRSYALATAFAGAATAFQTSSVDSWSDNPTNLGSTIVLTPDSMGDSPALILGLHPCGGTGSLYQSMTTLPDYIDELNFIMLFPTSNVEDGFNCWDAYSSATLTHDGGGDSEGLAGLVNWAIDEYGVDTSRVFMIGASSGAMETNVLAGSYPDLFAAGISYSGVPDGCWAGASSSTPLASDQSCPLGSKASTYTAEQWADLVYDSYPGYEGPWPRMQIVHGTADFAVTINNLNAQLEQWSTVHGVSFSQNVTNDPISGWTKIEYGDGTEVVGYEVAGGGHIPPFQIDITLEFFGLTGDNSGGGGSTTTTTTMSVPANTTAPTSTTMVTSTMSSAPATTTTASGDCSAMYGQCGGIGWAGATCCSQGSCQFSNDYYSQCL